MYSRYFYSDFGTGHSGENGYRFIYGYTFSGDWTGESFDYKDNLSGKKFTEDDRFISRG
ncbi:uncharacterized protein METZ01_LOCUS302663, partial [marine metagenome]